MTNEHFGAIIEYEDHLILDPKIKMRTIDYRAVEPGLLSPEIVGYLSKTHEYKDQQNLFIEAKPDALSELLDIARIQSTDASIEMGTIPKHNCRCNQICVMGDLYECERKNLN